MNGPRQSSRFPWIVAGVFAGLVGLAVTTAITWIFTLSQSVMLIVAGVARHAVPERAHETAEKYLGLADRGVFVTLLVLAGLAVCAYAGAASRRRWWEGAVLLVLLAAVPVFAVLTQSGSTFGDLTPVLCGLAAALFTLGVLGWLLRRYPEALALTPGPDLALRARTGRRALLGSVVAIAAGGAAGLLVGHRVGQRRRHVAVSRSLLRISEITEPIVPAQARVGLDGITPWRTRTEHFFVRDTVLQVPTIEPDDWTLRVHGMVEREIVLRYVDLVAMPLTEAWVTLGCRHNEVGGELVGNAWWSGVRVADVLARAGVLPQADSVLQTSHDGWQCVTPIGALTDSRDALLAFGMDGAPLTLEHGFPVRTVVPGVFGDAGACKWVVDLEVTRAVRLDDSVSGSDGVSALTLASRIDTPADGDGIELTADSDGVGQLQVGGVAWASRLGVSAVEVSLDGGGWRRALVARPGVEDTWVQWSAGLSISAGEHDLRVRAVDGDGRVQQGVLQGPDPGPASGWHTVRFGVNIPPADSD